MHKLIAIFLPPMQNVSGGFMVIVQLGNFLAEAGLDVCFVVRDHDTSYNTYLTLSHVSNVPIRHWDDVQLSPNHVWIVPEGWSNALALGLKAGARTIVYMQNWAFALRTLPEHTRWDQLPIEFLPVSSPVRRCLELLTGKTGPVLRPGIDRNLFYTNPIKNLEDPVEGIIRIAWMPRKNKIFGEQIKDGIWQRMSRTHPKIHVQWVEINREPHESVAEILRSCHIFLATGFPEGCPLPPLEAMASGCLVTGFTGLGGWDYMRQIELPDVPMPYLHKPIYPLREVPFGGNGFYVADAHVLGAVLALEQICLLLKNGGPNLAKARENIAKTADAYSQDTLKSNLQELLPFFTQ